MTGQGVRGRPWAWIAALAAVCVAGMFLQTLTLSPELPFVRLGAPVPLAMPGSWQIVAIVCGMAAALGLLSWRFARSLDGEPGRDLRWIVAAQAIVGLILTMAPVLLSSDIYAYVFWARLEGVWGINPYQRALVNPAADPVVRYVLVAYGNPPPTDSYGPLWTLLAAGVARLESHASLWFNLWSQRCVALAALVAATLGLARLSAGWAGDAMRRLALFATHPLVLYESATGGHNDIIMVAFAVWAFAVADAWPLIGGVLLGASVAIKWASALLVPIFFIKLLRRGVAQAALSICTAAAVFALCLLPFAATANAALFPMPRTGIGLSVIGFFYLLGTGLRAGADAGLTRALIVGFAAAFVLAFALCVRAYVVTRKRGALWATIIAALGSLPNIFPWYVQWLMPATADRGRLASYAWWLGMFAFLDYAFVIPAHVSVVAVILLALAIIAVPTYIALKQPREPAAAEARA